MEGLCRALADWCGELRLTQQELGLRAEKPAAAGAGREKGGNRGYLERL